MKIIIWEFDDDNNYFKKFIERKLFTKNEYENTQMRKIENIIKFL